MGRRGPKPRFKGVACPNPECSDYGIKGKGNITGNGTYKTKSGRMRKYICHTCDRIFCDWTKHSLLRPENGRGEDSDGS